MYQEPIFLQPVFKERIWGGTKLRDRYQYNIPSDQTGECWGISAHPNGPSIIRNGPLKGQSLLLAWKEHKELFGDPTSEEFPLLVKILDANNDLSVQVHPDDQYAQQKENSPYGKTECWYIIDCEDGAELIYGHHAKTKEEFQELVDKGKWDKLLRKVSIKPGDFFYVPSGTIHAIGKGTMILETQQSSDITYRVYDYDRTDSEGKKRELHIKASIEVANCPHHDPVIEQEKKKLEGLSSKLLVREHYFTVYHWTLKGTVEKPLDCDYLLASVLNGSGTISIADRTFSFHKGDHLIIPATVKNYRLTGEAELIVSHPTENEQMRIRQPK